MNSRHEIRQSTKSRKTYFEEINYLKRIQRNCLFSKSVRLDKKGHRLECCVRQASWEILIDELLHHLFGKCLSGRILIPKSRAITLTLRTAWLGKFPRDRLGFRPKGFSQASQSLLGFVGGRLGQGETSVSFFP